MNEDLKKQAEKFASDMRDASEQIIIYQQENETTQELLQRLLEYFRANGKKPLDDVN